MRRCAAFTPSARRLALQWENASAVIVVFDITNRESFTSVVKWLQRVKETLGPRSHLTGARVAAR